MTPSSRSKTSVPTTTNRRVRPRRDFEALTQRRLRAGKMFDDGSPQADVVRELGVSRETASQWQATWREHGVEGLRGAQRAGRLPRLTDAQLVKVELALAKGPKVNGFPTELWTLARIATVIERVTGVSYSTTQTWWVLRERLGWSRQRPARRAIDERLVGEAMHDALDAIVRAAWSILEATPPDMAADLMETGITLTGGGALIPGLAGELSVRTNVPTTVADEPLLAVARGAGEILASPSLLRSGRANIRTSRR